MAKKKKIIIAAICVVLVAVVAIVAVVIVKNKGNDNPTETTTVAETERPTTLADVVKDLDPNKYVMQKIDEKPYIVVLGEDGKHVKNDKNQILVVLTDENGNVVFDENGNPKTTWLDVSGTLTDRTGISGNGFTISIPAGWKPHGAGYIVMEKSQKNMIQCSVINKYNELSFNEFMNVLSENQAKTHENHKKNGSTVSFESRNITFSDANISGVYQKEVIHNKNGGLANYKESIYFEMNGERYWFVYISSDDESLKAAADFNFLDFVNTNFKVS